MHNILGDNKALLDHGWCLTLTHMVGHYTNLALWTVLLLITTIFALAIRGVTPLLHAGTILAFKPLHNMYIKYRFIFTTGSLHPPILMEFSVFEGLPRQT